jgi:hypothetical protein
MFDDDASKDPKTARTEDVESQRDKACRFSSDPNQLFSRLADEEGNNILHSLAVSELLLVGDGNRDEIKTNDHRQMNGILMTR